ncbi:MAG TPA: fumarylacetoacetate hydrolase family protein [Woeseiaceae bacterium]|nr:fumarylacetoacetate hydrolase family protein [Woeseiaceae bacterium]
MFDVPRPSLPVSGSNEVFPVRRIYCVGRNYAAHARESGGDPDREAPFYFMKPADALMPNDARVPYPPRTSNLHHEIELVVAIGRGGKDIPVEGAPAHIFGYAVGIDLTRRDLQTEAKNAGRPWDTAKGFDHSAPVSAIHTVAEVGHPASGRIWLEVNGEPRQDGDLEELIWSVPEAIAELSTLFALAPGDLIFTGTPAGVGPLVAGDIVRGGVEAVDEIRIAIAGKRGQ